MKNTHVLPTDKPSRLHFDDKLFLSPKYQLSSSINSIVEGRNIYITSDEEVKEGVDQWYLDKALNEPYNSGAAQYSSKQDVIILTTDQDLIKDGVQVIDDEFIEWFVQNPSCEEVEIKKWTDYKLENDKEIPFFSYKIIIPKEEPKQETLKEAFVKFMETNFNGQLTKGLVLGAMESGAKWQQERSYSEEEVLEIIYKFKQTCPYYIEKWFKQFKKK